MITYARACATIGAHKINSPGIYCRSLLAVRVGPGGPTRAVALIESSRVLPILDGFDEIEPGLHHAALRQLNTIPDTPMVITSRVAEYTNAVSGTDVLTAAAVVELDDLTLEDLADYLPRTAAGHRAGIWDPVLEQMRTQPHAPGPALLCQVLTNPLMVFLARTIYSDTPGHNPTELLDTHRFPTAQAVQDHLLAAFVPAVYQADQPSNTPWWPADRAHRYLTYLAGHLHQKGTRDLAWWQLRDTIPRWRRTLVFAVVDGLVAAVLVGLAAGRLDGLPDRFSDGLWVGLPDWFSEEPSLGLPSGLAVPLAVPLAGLAEVLGAVLTAALTAGLASGLTVGLTRGLSSQRLRGELATAVTAGLASGLVVGLALMLALGFTAWLASGFTAWLASSLAAGLASELTAGIPVVLVAALASGLASGLTVGLTRGLGSQRLRGKLATAVTVGLGVMLAVGLAVGLAVALRVGLALGLTAGLASGLTIGLGTQRLRGKLATAVTVGLAVMLAFGLGFGLVAGLAVWFSGLRSAGPQPARTHLQIRGRARFIAGRFAFGLTAGLVVGLVAAGTLELSIDVVFAFAVVSAFVVALAFGLETPVDAADVVGAAESLARDRRNTLRKILAIGLAATMFLAATSATFATIAAPMAAVVVGYVSVRATSAWIYWLVLVRGWLPLTGRLPWQVQAFLTDAYQRGVLRQTGVIYQFRHARLQDHLIANSPAAASAVTG